MGGREEKIQDKTLEIGGNKGKMITECDTVSWIVFWDTKIEETLLSPE